MVVVLHSFKAKCYVVCTCLRVFGIQYIPVQSCFFMYVITYCMQSKIKYTVFRSISLVKSVKLDYDTVINLQKLSNFCKKNLSILLYFEFLGKVVSRNALNSCKFWNVKNSCFLIHYKSNFARQFDQMIKCWMWLHKDLESLNIEHNW